MGDFSVTFGIDHCFHLHGFKRKQFLSFRDFVASSDSDTDNHSGHCGGDMSRVGRIGFGPFCSFRFDRLVDDFDFARLSVEFEENGSYAVRSRFAHSEELDNQTFTGFDVDGEFLTECWPEEEDRSR